MSRDAGPGKWMKHTGVRAGKTPILFKTHFMRLAS
jgi:hypothetical protein